MNQQSIFVNFGMQHFFPIDKWVLMLHIYLIFLVMRITPSSTVGLRTSDECPVAQAADFRPNFHSPREEFLLPSAELRLGPWRSLLTQNINCCRLNLILLKNAEFSALLLGSTGCVDDNAKVAVLNKIKKNCSQIFHVHLIIVGKVDVDRSRTKTILNIFLTNT